MEIKLSQKLKSLYTVSNLLLFLIYCPLPVIVLQIVKQRPRYLYDIWSFIIGVLGIVVLILIQLYLFALSKR